MKTIKVSEATELQLNWLVAKCEGILDPVHGEPAARVVLYVDQWQTYMRLNPSPQVYYSDRYEPTTSWAQGGPLLNQHKISRTIDHSGLWTAYAGYNLNDEQRHMQCDRSELVAGLRCLVALNLGEVVEVPDELL